MLCNEYSTCFNNSVIKRYGKEEGESLSYLERLIGGIVVFIHCVPFLFFSFPFVFLLTAILAPRRIETITTHPSNAMNFVAQVEDHLRDLSAEARKTHPGRSIL